MLEKWKPIQGYDNKYQVSNLGRIKSLSRVVVTSRGQTINVKEKILSQRKSFNGYLTVTLGSKNNRGPVKVHRLVGLSFIPNPENKFEINHKDTNKCNNCVENLEWSTHSENQKHAFKHNLYNRKGEHNSCNKLKTEEVIEIRKRKYNGEKIGKVFLDFKDKISKSGFKTVWYYCTWKHLLIKNLKESSI